MNGILPMSKTKATMFVFAGNNGSGKSTVKNGGHHIETKDIIRRNVTSMNNLLSHLDLIDQVIVVDNSKADGEFILEADKQGIKYHLNELPEWTQLIDRRLQIKY